MPYSTGALDLEPITSTSSIVHDTARPPAARSIVTLTPGAFSSTRSCIEAPVTA
jgi:hypothetical protein